MRRRIGIMLAALVMALPLSAQDKSTDEKGNNRAAQFTELQKDFKKSAEEATTQLRKAQSQEELLKIVKKLSKDFTPRVLQLTESDPKDKVSGNVLFWAVDNVPLEGNQVYDLLAENWAADARIKNLCLRMTQMRSEAAEKLLVKVSEENTDKDARGLAVFALANMSKEKSEGQGDVKAAEQAEKMFERVGKEFADVRLARGTAGDQAKSSLEEIRKRGVGKKMPNLECENLQGKKVQLTDHQGKVVVLDIWATWCGPCKAMIPHEREMVEKLKDKPFTFISVSADDKKDTLEKFLESNKMPWTHWWNGASGGILKELEVQFFPTIYVLDGEGVIRYKNIRSKQLEEAVDKLLAETKARK